jgi:hypothetical protein
MRANETQEIWQEWRDAEIARAKMYLDKLGYAIDTEQAHVSGERFLVSGHKLVLTGTEKGSDSPVVIKWSTEESGMEEIRDEHERRRVLANINFANRTLRLPLECYFLDDGGVVVLVTRFIPQERIFIELLQEEQFFFALSALESQEGTHVATHEQRRALGDMGRTMQTEDYLTQFHAWCVAIGGHANIPHTLRQALAHAEDFLVTYRHSIGRYNGFLAHTDFVPHNLRITGRQIVMLDHTSLIIGNKYESWARFINFMTLYNPELEKMLLRYVKENRGEDEYLCLRAMRIYKLGFLLYHHTRAHEKSEGNLHLLTGERITFWGRVLESVLRDEAVSPEVVAHYKSRAITLRSPEETERQKEISGWK